MLQQETGGSGGLSISCSLFLRRPGALRVSRSNAEHRMRELLDIDVPHVLAGGDRPQASGAKRATGSAEACYARRYARQHLETTPNYR